MKERFKNYGFWISLVSGIIMVMQAMGLRVNVPYVNEVITAVLGVFVVLGIINNPKDGNGYTDSKKDDND